jgi:uncharacterized cupin superfamily protein
MNKIDIVDAPVRAGSRYPKPYDEPCRNKLRRRLGAAAGLKTLGINLLELEPGAWSSQLHWHALAEEFVLVLEGEVVLAPVTAPVLRQAIPMGTIFKTAQRSGRSFSKSVRQTLPTMRVIIRASI